MNAILLSAVLLAHVPEHGLIMVARDGSIQARDEKSGAVVWTAGGIMTAHRSAQSEDGELFAVIDSISNRVATVAIATRRSIINAVPETPIALGFSGNDLFVLSRDAGVITRIRGGDEIRQIPTISDPTHLVARPDRLIVYSSTSGRIADLDPRTLTTRREGRISRFASDLAADLRRAYLAYPRSGKVAAVRIDTLTIEEEFEAGAVPVDLDLSTDANLISAGDILVADPSSKRIWTLERTQSEAEAFGRGLLRGIVGLGLYSPRSVEFPTGIDRVWTEGKRRFAWDSSSGTLYLAGRGKARAILKARSDREFVIAGDRLVVWSNERQTVEFRPIPQ